MINKESQLHTLSEADFFIIWFMFSSGVYFYQLKTPEYTSIKKMVLLK
jgi:hypothetical protein